MSLCHGPLALLLNLALGVGPIVAQEPPGDPSAPGDRPVFEERIEVLPATWTTIAVDRRGRLITDLRPDQLRARVGDHEVPVLAVELDRSYVDTFHPEDALARAGTALAELPGRPLLVYVGWGLGLSRVPTGWSWTLRPWTLRPWTLRPWTLPFSTGDSSDLHGSGSR